VVSPLSWPEISDPDVYQHETRKYQGDREPGFGRRTGCRLLLLRWLALRRRAFEGGNVVFRRSLRIGGKLGRRAGPTHVAVVGLVHELDGGFGGLSFRHLLEQCFVTLKEGLGFLGQR